MNQRQRPKPNNVDVFILTVVSGLTIFLIVWKILEEATKNNYQRIVPYIEEYEQDEPHK